MARITDEKITEAFKPYLQENEQLQQWAYGVKQPNILLIIVLIALAVLPGIIAIFLLTKNYFVGLTNRRFIVLNLGGGVKKVKEISEYSLDKLPEVKTKTGPLFTHISIKDPSKPFVAKFHRAGKAKNREHSMAIAEALSARQMVISQ